eukprot:414126-Amphidinium_carterae.1
MDSKKEEQSETKENKNSTMRRNETKNTKNGNAPYSNALQCLVDKTSLPPLPCAEKPYKDGARAFTLSRGF